MKRVKMTKVLPYVEWVMDHVADFAAEHISQYADTGPEEAVPDIESDLMDAVEQFGGLEDVEFTEKRAALVRIVARAVGLLVLDEAIRGTKLIQKEMKRLDHIGFLKPARVKAKGRRGSR